MKSFLARSRRLFLAGFVSLVILIAMGKQPVDNSITEKLYYYFFSLSPVIYLFLTLVSAWYLRRFGQFAEFHKQHNYFHTFFRAIGSDIVSPFKNLMGFFTALFGKYPDVLSEDMIKKSKAISVRRFVWTLLVILFCCVGVLLVF